MLKEGRLYTEGFKWRQHHLYSIMHKHVFLKDEDVPLLVKDTIKQLFESSGPSALRTFEVNLQGYQYVCNHQNPRINRRKVVYEEWCRYIVPALPAIKLYAPSRKVRRKIGVLKQEYLKVFGRLTLCQHLQAWIFIVFATYLKFIRFLPRPAIDPKTKKFYYHSDV